MGLTLPSRDRTIRNYFVPRSPARNARDSMGSIQWRRNSQKGQTKKRPGSHRPEFCIRARKRTKGRVAFAASIGWVARRHELRSEEYSNEVSPLLGRQSIPARISRMARMGPGLPGISSDEMHPLLPSLHGALGFYDRKASCAAGPASHSPPGTTAKPQPHKSTRTTA